MITPIEWQLALAQLFPPYVKAVAAPSGEERLSPYEDEVLAVARAVPRRRLEFLSGRHCAHAALGALGLDAGPILVGPRREPRWPEGAVGSIAHAGDWSMAAAARATDVWGVGIDVELLEPALDDHVDRLVRTTAEREQTLDQGHPLAPHAAKVVFSAKEAAYKCLFPRTRWALEFGDVEVTLDLDGCTYEARVDERFATAGLSVGSLRGRFRVVDGYVLSGLCLAPDGTSL